VRDGEPEVGSKELLNVRTADVVCLLNLDDAQNLEGGVRSGQWHGRWGEGQTDVDRAEAGTMPSSHLLLVEFTNTEGFETYIG
jgi:hypothetical protein